MQTLNLAGLIALFGTVTMIIMQTVKPLFEKLPGIMLHKNRALHDNALRAIQYLINLALLVLAARFGGAAMFAGWNWWDFLSVSIGQAITSQVTYAYGRQGGSGNPLPDPMVLGSSYTYNAATPNAAPVVTGQSDIPEIPRP